MSKTTDEIKDIEFQIDVLIKRREETALKLDILANQLEMKRLQAAFEGTKYTPGEAKPMRLVSFVGISDAEHAQSELVR